MTQTQAPVAPNLQLLQPGVLGPYTLANRLIMAPMTRNRARRDGTPGPMAALYYAQRASAGCIITEATCVSPQAVGYPFTPGIFTSRHVDGWRQVVDAVHRAGGRIFLQLFHAGRVSHPSLQPGAVLPVAPSAIGPVGEAMTYDGKFPFVLPRALLAEEVPYIVEQFRIAALNALDARFDGVELHAANGYLLDQFLRDGPNHRTDAYGGSIENRVRLLSDVVGAVASVWGPDRVGVRLSPLNAFNTMFDSSPARTFTAAVEMLSRFGLAYLHIIEEDGSPVAGPRFELDRLRHVWRGTYIVNGHYDSSLPRIRYGKSELTSSHSDGCFSPTPISRDASSCGHR
jgi:N-ethylmaleimide reductase